MLNDSQVAKIFTLIVALAVLLVAACAPQTEPTAQPGGNNPTTEPTPEATEMIEANAYIDSIDVLIMESFPVQVAAMVSGNLQDGCTAIESVSASHEGNTFTIDIQATRPADAICTQALVPFEERVSLDVLGLEAGDYTVVFGDASASFTLDMDNSLPSDSDDLDEDASDSSHPLHGTSWSLGEIIVSGESITIPEGAEVNINFEDGIVNGKSGCNSFSGTYSIDGDTLETGEIVSTLMACADDLMEVETHFLGALQNPTGFEMNMADRLTITSENTTLVFGQQMIIDEDSHMSDALDGTSWTLDEAIVAGDSYPVPDGVVVTLNFENGTMNGNGGCNSYSAEYSADAGSIEPGMIVSTLMICDNSDIETIYFGVLQSVIAYEVNGDSLVLRSEDGSLTFSAN